MSGRYTVQRVYLVTCTQCQHILAWPDDAPAQITTTDDVRMAKADHDAAFHGGPARPPKRRGKCRACGREFSLNSGGGLRYHSRGSGAYCKGAGMLPAEAP